MNRRDALALLTSLPAVGSIARADVKPHSVIVITCHGAVSSETAERIREAARQIWPDHKCAVLCDGMDLRVLDEVPKPQKQQCPYCHEWCAHGFCGRCERVLPL